MIFLYNKVATFHKLFFFKIIKNLYSEQYNNKLVKEFTY